MPGASVRDQGTRSKHSPVTVLSAGTGMALVQTICSPPKKLLLSQLVCHSANRSTFEPHGCGRDATPQSLSIVVEIDCRSIPTADEMRSKTP